MPSRNDQLIDDLMHARCAEPFSILGWQTVSSGQSKVLRIWRPDAWKVTVKARSGDLLGEAEPVGGGLFQLVLSREDSSCAYRLSLALLQGEVIESEDPYAFSEACFQSIPDEPEHSYCYLGGRLQKVQWLGQEYNGVMFRVYAPHARSISVIGSFNHWDGRCHPMHSSRDGIWRLFIPGVGAGALYKFEIRNQSGDLLPHKADPYGYYAEQPPGNASIVYDPQRYIWQDQHWHDHSGMDRPVSIYEVHLGSWRKEKGDWIGYRALAEQLIAYVKEMGFTHIECLPVHEHPFTGSWGYQPVGLFAPTSRYGSPDDFKAFVDACHQADIGVILDWVPAHFPADNHGLARFDGSCLYEYEDPKRGWHPDWKTHIYDYGKPDVRQFLISNAVYWLEEFHIDGLRVDAVASMLYLDYSRNDGEWEPNHMGGNEHLEAVFFLKELNETIYRLFPDRMMIAEESSSWPGVTTATYDSGLGFGYKWNMGWMNDSLEYMKRNPEHRAYHHDEMMFSMVYNYDEHFILPLSHDEVVHGKGTLLSRMPGDEWQKFANLRAFYGYMYGHPGKKLLFMGAEIGSEKEWNHDGELDWALLADSPLSQGLKAFLQRLNHLYQEHPALWHSDYDPEGFQWLVTDDWQQSVFAFCRVSGDAPPVVVVSNLTPVVRHSYRIGVPRAGVWKELLNSDAGIYGGSGISNAENLYTENEALHYQKQSLVITLPPLSTTFLSLKSLSR